MPLLPRLALALTLLGLLLQAPAAQGGGKPPVDPEALQVWWTSAARMWMGETAYKISKPLVFQDGVCKASLNEGVIIPVWSGQKPVSERIVGSVFIGTGDLEMSFPSRADAWSFATHMISRGEDRATMEAIARQEAPFRTSLSRALFLGSDPKVQKMLMDLRPIRSGSMLSEGSEGIDEVYMVTEERGKLAATVVATNVLPNRRRLLERAGLDVTAMIRQDRLLSEELGVPAEELRLVADFRTGTRYGVAALDGATVGPNDYDEWLTCFRDGLGYSDTGYRSMAFAHGVDVDGIRHFRRFSGEIFPRETGSPGPEPARWMAPVYAKTEVELIPTTFANTQKVTVQNDLRIRALGGPLQHVTLRLPTAGTVEGTFNLQKLSTSDGKALAWSGLSADLRGIASASSRPGKASTAAQSAESDLAGASTESAGAEAMGEEVVNVDNLTDSSPTSGSRAGLIDSVDIEASETDAVKKTATRYEIIVLLPEPVPEGGEVDLHLEWTATWPWANWSTADRPLGPTTGLQEIVPDLVPALGGTAWDFETTVRFPSSGLRTIGAAVSGDTKSDAINDEDGWRTIVATGKAGRRPGVAFGRWYEVIDPPAKDLPGVRVSLFTTEEYALPAFPPEVRRVVSFLGRFLPKIPLGEIEVFQGKDTFTGAAMNGRISAGAYGLVGVQQATYGGVGGASTIVAEDPHFAHSMVARQVAGQIWGQLVAPATARDEWILDALSEAYAAFYVRAAFGPADYDKRVSAVRESIERPVERSYNYKQTARSDRPLSLTGSTPQSDLSSKLLDDYGFYVLSEMLRFKIGDRAFFLALDRLAKRRSGQRLTTEQLQEAFEETSEQDLSDFFDYWVHGGLVPEIEARVHLVEGSGGTKVEGVLCTNVPVGRIDVPVVVRDQKGDREVQALIPVEAGRGSFQVEDRQGKVKVEIDPDGMIVAFGRRVQEVSSAPTCDGF